MTRANISNVGGRMTLCCPAIILCHNKKNVSINRQKIVELLVLNSLYYFLIICFLLIGVFVFLKSKDGLIAKKFLVLMMSIVLWVGLNFSLEFISGKYSLLILRGTYATAAIMIFSIFIFSLSFPKRITQNKAVVPLALLITGFLIYLSLSSLLVTGYHKNSFIFYPEYGNGFILYAILVLAIIVLLITNLSIQYKNSHGITRKQVLFFAVGFVITAVLISTTDLIIPVITHNSLYANFGPLGTVVLLVFTAYAITEHGLLNTKVILSEIWAFLLCIAIFIWLITHFSIGNLIGFLFIFSICVLFIRSVISESGKESELLEANQKLKKDKGELVELDRMKDEFLQMATHELNTPIAAIQGKLDMAVREDMCELDDKQKGYFGPVLDQTNRLARLSKDVLNVARIDQHRLVVNASATDLNVLISQVVSGFDDKLKERNNTISYLPEPLPKLMIDQSKISEVLTNLITNANKFTENGKITVAAKLQGDKVVISVSDTGIGINEQYQRHLFEKFYQAGRFDPNHPQEQQGSGLGLYISRSVVNLHGGEMWLESIEGKGSTFYFSLPLEYKEVKQTVKIHSGALKLRVL